MRKFSISLGWVGHGRRRGKGNGDGGAYGWTVATGEVAGGLVVAAEGRGAGDAEAERRDARRRRRVEDCMVAMLGWVANLGSEKP